MSKQEEEEKQINPHEISRVSVSTGRNQEDMQHESSFVNPVVMESMNSEVSLKKHFDR